MLVGARYINLLSSCLVVFTYFSPLMMLKASVNTLWHQIRATYSSLFSLMFTDRHVDKDCTRRNVCPLYRRYLRRVNQPNAMYQCFTCSTLLRPNNEPTIISVIKNAPDKTYQQMMLKMQNMITKVRYQLLGKEKADCLTPGSVQQPTNFKEVCYRKFHKYSQLVGLLTLAQFLINVLIAHKTA